MALEFLNSRVSFLGVGVPGFSTSGNQVLRVNGGLGVDTTSLRGQVDVPQISIRGELIDAAQETGGLGYFLSQDIEGVKWANVNPLIPFSIYVSQDNVQVGLSSFTGLNFFTPGEPGVLTVKPDELNPSIARISLDVRFSKISVENQAGTGTNFFIATGFGTDGTYASIPGYGTSEAVGLVSIGIGTNRPVADLQVGVGSTGVEIFGPEGRINAEIIQTKSLEVDDNLRVNSLIVDPGIATFIGSVFAENQVFISTSITNQGIVTGNFTVGPSTENFFGLIREVGGDSSLGFTTIGYTNNLFPPEGLVGLGTTGPALVVTGVSTFNGLVTTNYDLFVGNNLYVKGRQVIDEIDAKFLNVSIAATINQTFGVGASFTQLYISGLTTLTDFNYNIGFGTTFSARTGFFTDADIGIGTIGFSSITDANIGVATVAFGSITDANIGVATVAFGSITGANIGVATVGFATIGLGTTGSGAYFVGINTFDNGPPGSPTDVGFSTFTNDLYVGNDFFVGGTQDIDTINARNIFASGIGTIVNLVYDVGIGTTTVSNNLIFNVGVGTTLNVTGVASLGFATITEAFLGLATAKRIDADFIKTQDLEVVGTATVGFATIRDSFTGIATVGFASIGLGTTGSAAYFVGINTFDNGPAGSPTNVGFSTFTNDLYVGNDFYVGGTQFNRDLEAVNLFVSGIGTIVNLVYDVGIGTTTRTEKLEYGFGIGTNFDVSGILTAQNINVGAGTFRDFLRARDVNIGGAATITRANITNLFAMDAGIDNLNVRTGFATFFQFTNTDTTGIATIKEADVDFIDAERANIGILTVDSYLNVTAGATFTQRVDIENFADINREFVEDSNIDELQVRQGVATNFAVREKLTFQSGIGTELNISGVATIAFATITDSFLGITTVGFMTVGTSTLNAPNYSLYSIGTAFFDAGASGRGNPNIGVALTIRGDLFVDGDVDVTGNINIPNIDVEDLEVGVITVRRRIDARGEPSNIGIASFSDVIIEDNLEVQGITTLGDKDTVGASATFYPTGEVFVGGISTFNNVVTFNNNIFTPDDDTLPGIVTLGREDRNVGFVTVRSNLFVRDTATIDTTVTKNLNVTGIATIAQLGFNTGFGTDFRISGITTLGFTSIGPAPIGLGTSGAALFVTGISSFNGFTTFRGDVFITGKLFVDNELVFKDLETETFRVTGFGTAKNFQISNLKVGFGSTEPGISTFVGFATFGSENNLTGTGYSQRASLYSTGISTFAGIGSFIGTEGDGAVTAFVYIDGDLEVNGNLDIPNLDIDDLTVGILTVRRFIDLKGNFIATEGAGIVTFNNPGGVGILSLTYNVGAGTTARIGFATITDAFIGVATIGFATITDADIGFATVGLTTVGVATIRDLNVLNDAKLNTLRVSGVSTLQQIDLKGNFIATEGAGIVTFNNPGGVGIVSLTYNVGAGTTARIGFATITDATIGVATVGLLSVTDVEAGVITAFKGDFKQLDVDFILLDDLIVTGVATITTGILTTATIDNVVSSGIITTKQLDFSDKNTPDDDNYLTSEFATTVQTTGTAPVLLASFSSLLYNSFEITIQGSEGTRFHATKLFGTSNADATPSVFFTEYSTVFNASPVGSFNVVGALNEIQVIVSSNTTNPTDYVVRINATRRFP